jgi:hypothetical protein
MGAAAIFDTSVASALCRIADLPLNALDDPSSPAALLASLPLAAGGLGVRRLAPIAEVAYAASLDPASDSQEVCTKRIDEATIIALKTDPSHAESAFGLLLHASGILSITLAKCYYIFKFFRRRQTTNFPRNAPAAIWPCIRPLLIDWVDVLLGSPGSPYISRAEHAWLLVSDASEWGWGAYLFRPDGTCSCTGAEWVRADQVGTPIIAELEAKAAKNALVFFRVPQDQPIHLVVDNTTVLHGLQRGRSGHFWLNSVIEGLAQYKILTVTYVRSEQNIADKHSRGEHLLQPTSSTLDRESGNTTAFLCG